MSRPRHHAIDRFPLIDGELSVGGVRLSLLAARVGRTPFYAYDRQLLRARVAELRAVLPAGLVLHYAVKANPMPAVVNCIATLVDGLDVASGAELLVALDAGVDPRDVSFAGPGKSEVELQQAVAAGILVNVESTREIQLLAEISQRLGREARVALRVNPDFELKSSGMKMGAGPSSLALTPNLSPQSSPKSVALNSHSRASTSSLARRICALKRSAKPRPKLSRWRCAWLSTRRGR